MTPSGSNVRVPPYARRLWSTLAGVEDALQPGTVTVVRGSVGLCPPGWVGVVRLGDAYVIERGDADPEVLDALRSLDDPADPRQVIASLDPRDVLGPGELAYLPADAEVAMGGTDDIAEVPVDPIRGWLATMPPEDVDESSVGEMERVLVLRRGGAILGAAGHVDWPTDVGHVGILVAPDARGTGVGVALGAAATRRVLDHGRWPQWRAAAWNDASRAVARRIGYVEVGRQLSFRLQQ